MHKTEKIFAPEWAIPVNRDTPHRGVNLDTHPPRLKVFIDFSPPEPITNQTQSPKSSHSKKKYSNSPPEFLLKPKPYR